MASYMEDEFKQLVTKYNEEAEGISSWSEYLQGLKKDYTSNVESATQQASYDISGAYANYKKAQLNLLQNQQLGAGFKEQLGSGLKSSYASAYGNVQQQLAKNIGTYYAQYQEDVGDAEKQISESASYLDAINRALYDFGKKDINKRGESRAKGGLGYYETITNINPETGETEYNTYLTGYGKAELADLLLNPQKGEYFTNYLAETDKKTYDWYMQNLDLARGTIAGLDKGVSSFSPEEKKIMMAAEDAERKYSALVGGKYDKTKTFKNEAERKEYYTRATEDELYKQRNVDKNINTISTKYKTNNLGRYSSKVARGRDVASDINSVLLDDAAYYDESSNRQVSGRFNSTLITLDTSKLRDYEKKIFTDLGFADKNGKIQIQISEDGGYGFVKYSDLASAIKKLKRGA